jgi:hypothetical protein
MNTTIALVIAALIQIESGGRDTAVGDGGRAVGALQLWPVAVAEANRLEAVEARREGRKARAWTVDDRTDRKSAVAMAEVTLRHHYRRGATDPVELGARWRNPYSPCPEWYKDKLRRELARLEGGGK